MENVLSDNYISKEIFKRYLEVLKNTSLPAQINVQHYLESEISRRRNVAYYCDEIAKYPNKINPEKRAKKLNIRKSSYGPMHPVILTPMIVDAKDSAKILSDRCSHRSILYYLIEHIIIDKMTEEYQDRTIELSALWYNLNYFQNGLLNGDKDNYEYLVEDISDYALATSLFRKYKIDKGNMSQRIKSIVTREETLAQLMKDYGVSLDNERIINELEDDCKKLTLLR